MGQQPPEDRSPVWEGGTYFPPPSNPNQPPLNSQFLQQGPQGQYPMHGNYPLQQQYPQQGYPRQQNYQQYQQPPMMPPIKPPSYPAFVPQKWYRTNAGIIALLIFFFPAGLYLMWKYSRWPKNAKLIVTGMLAFCVLMAGIANAASPIQQGSQVAVPTQQPIVVSTKAPIPTLTPTPQPIHYPPTTEADLRGLAAKGTVSAILEFHSESVGLTGACPQPKREITVDPSVTGQQLAEDLLAYFYTQQLDSPCGSIVFSYHNQGEANDIYTAGRVRFDVTDSSGASNVDPNASNLKYTLTLDIGGAIAGQEYVVTY